MPLVPVVDAWLVSMSLLCRAMASSVRVSALYRQILKAAREFPSKKRTAIIEDIKTTFHEDKVWPISSQNEDWKIYKRRGRESSFYILGQTKNFHSACWTWSIGQISDECFRGGLVATSHSLIIVCRGMHSENNPTKFSLGSPWEWRLCGAASDWQKHDSRKTKASSGQSGAATGLHKGGFSKSRLASLAERQLSLARRCSLRCTLSEGGSGSRTDSDMQCRLVDVNDSKVFKECPRIYIGALGSQGVCHFCLGRIQRLHNNRILLTSCYTA